MKRIEGISVSCNFVNLLATRCFGTSLDGRVWPGHQEERVWAGRVRGEDGLAAKSGF